jgi:hypothetical protein
MEAYNQDEVYEKDPKLFQAYSKARTWVTALLGIIITFIGIAVIFVVASLEGTKEITASNSDAGKILSQWRVDNNLADNVYPQEKIDIFLYDDKEYYFIIDSYNEDGEILKWHFAYDGGIEYLFKDYKFYVIVALSIVISVYVAQVNYTSTVRALMEKESFARTLKKYQDTKKQVEKFTHYISDFCNYKNKQAYETIKRDIIEEAGINYDFYNSSKFDKSKLEKWQKEKLNKIKKINFKRLHSSDLLQEQGYLFRKMRFLPPSQKEHQTSFMITGTIQKIITSFLSGLMISFGIIIGNWVLGAAYGFTVLLSYVSAVIIAADFVNSTLRNRFIGKSDLLNEFNNLKDVFIKEEALRLEEIKKEEALRLEETKKQEEKLKQNEIEKQSKKEYVLDNDDLYKKKYIKFARNNV